MLTTLGTGVVVFAAVVGLVWTVTRSGSSVRRAEGAVAPGGPATPTQSTARAVVRASTAPGRHDPAPDPATGASPSSTSGGGEDALHATIALAPGSCRYDADAEDFEASGTVRAVTGSGVVEVDVTWSDATGELDSASDIVEVAAGGTASWEASTALSDPPRDLTCRVTQG
jgi:hypothetical protein